VDLATVLGESLTLMLIDLNQFKAVRVRYGKAAADEVLEQIAHQLQALKHVAQGDSLDEIRQQVARTVDMVSLSMSEREEHHAKHLKQLGTRLRSVRKELFAAKQKVSSKEGRTGIFPKKALKKAVQGYVDLATVLGESLTLMLIDLNQFKAVRVRYGKAAADEVLEQIAKAVSKLYTRKHDFIVRLGETTFAVLLPATESSDAPLLCERLLQTLDKLKPIQKKVTIKVSCSMGVASLRPDDDPSAFVRRAEAALNRAKDKDGQHVEIDGQV